MAESYDSTTGIRALQGSSLISDIDGGFLAMATDVAALLGRAAGALQEGVMDAGSYEVTQASGGASMVVDVASNVGGGAFVNNDSATGQLLRYVAPTALKTSKTIGTAHATLPRVDRIVLENDGDVTVVAGTATSGATLDNLTGAAAVPSNAILLADVHIPATDTTLANAQIRDRRAWARGAHVVISRTAGDYGTSSTSMVDIDATNLKPRIECSGVPLVVELSTNLSDDTASARVDLDVGVDGTAQNLRVAYGGTGYPANMRIPTAFRREFTPSAGSHLISVMWLTSNGGSIAGLDADSNYPLIMTIREMVAQNTKNNATTSG